MRLNQFNSYEHFMDHLKVYLVNPWNFTAFFLMEKRSPEKKVESDFIGLYVLSENFDPTERTSKKPFIEGVECGAEPCIIGLT